MYLHTSRASERMNERSGWWQRVRGSVRKCKLERAPQKACDFCVGRRAVCLARGRNERRLFSLASSRCILLCSPFSMFFSAVHVESSSLCLPFRSSSCASLLPSPFTAPPAAPANHLRRSISLACFTSCTAHLYSVHVPHPFSRGTAAAILENARVRLWTASLSRGWRDFLHGETSVSRALV